MGHARHCIVKVLVVGDSLLTCNWMNAHAKFKREFYVVRTVQRVLFDVWCFATEGVLKFGSTKVSRVVSDKVRYSIATAHSAGPVLNLVGCVLHATE